MGIMTDTFSMGPLPVLMIFRPACTMSQVTVQICRHSDCYGYLFLKDPLKGAGTKGAYFAPLVPLLPFTKRKRGMEGTDTHSRQHRSFCSTMSLFCSSFFPQ